jgi:hypothetical protein
MMYGHVEEPADWVRHLLLLRAIQKRTGGFTEFVPLGFIHENTRLYRHGGARPGAKREEHLRVHALARVLLYGAIKNLQVSWVKLGFEMSLACLRAGANDFSGTLMEESISKAAGATFGEYVPPEEFRSRIRSIGRVPAERTTTYRIRRIFDEPEDDPRTVPSRRRLLSDSHAGTPLTSERPEQCEEKAHGCADAGGAICAGRGDARGHHSRSARRALRGKDFRCHELRAGHAISRGKSMGDPARGTANF